MRLAILLAFTTGFVSLSYELVWYRTFAFVTGATSSGFGMLLGFFLLGIAFGSSRVRTLLHGADDAAYVTRLAWLVFVANVASALVVPALALFASLFDFRPAFLLVLLGAGLMGATLPVLSHVAIDPDAKAGFNLSLVYIGNIAGSALGSVITGFVLTDMLTTEQLALALAGAGFVAAVLATAMGSTAGARRKVAAAGALAMGALVLLRGPLYGRLYERLLYKKMASTRAPFEMVMENRHGVAVVTKEHVVYGGGAYDGAINVTLDDNKNNLHRTYAVEAMVSEHPGAPKMRDVFMIGLSSGSWAQVIANLPSTKSLTIVEINPGYLDLIARYDVVKSLLTNPKVKIEIDDARRWLRRHPGQKFDFIVANNTFYWRAHMTNLMSVEFLDLVREHLHPWGVHYYNTTWSTDAFRTAITQFPHAMRVVNFVAVSDAPFRFDEDAWRRTLDMSIEGAPVLTNPQKREALVRFGASLDAPDPAAQPRLEGRPSLVARLGTGHPITDDNMLAETRDPLMMPTFIE